MKMWKIYAILSLCGISLLFLNFFFSLGWTVGHVIMATLAVLRERFYSIILSQTTFSYAQYFAYLIFVIVLIALPLGVSFYVSHIINPYALFGAYFLDRFIHFGWNLFVKEEADAS